MVPCVWETVQVTKPHLAWPSPHPSEGGRKHQVAGDSPQMLNYCFFVRHWATWWRLRKGGKNMEQSLLSSPF